MRLLFTLLVCHLGCHALDIGVHKVDKQFYQMLRRHAEEKKELGDSLPRNGAIHVEDNDRSSQNQHQGKRIYLRADKRRVTKPSTRYDLGMFSKEIRRNLPASTKAPTGSTNPQSGASNPSSGSTKAPTGSNNPQSGAANPQPVSTKAPTTSP